MLFEHLFIRDSSDNKSYQLTETGNLDSSREMIIKKKKGETPFFQEGSHEINVTQS